MARPQNNPILAQLRSARTTPDRTAALRALKNEVVGHVQRKEAWVGLGVLEPIVRTISSRSFAEKPNGKEPQKNQFASPHLSDEDGTKLQALQLVASFAHGGPTFLSPLHASQVLPALLSNISPYHNPPQIVVAALRALTDIANASALADSSSPLDIQSVANVIFAYHNLESINAILSASSSNYLIQSQVSLAAGLITRLCTNERQRNALTLCGILDTLASRMAGFAVSDGFVVPGAALAAQTDGLSGAFPQPAPSNAALGPILDAIATVVGDSKYRAHRLVYSPAILAVFPSTQTLRDFFGQQPDFEYTEANYSKHLDLTAMECVLPAIPIAASRSASTSQSSLVSDRSDPQTAARISQQRASSTFSTGFSQPNAILDIAPDEIESPLIPWLVHLVRTRSEYERLMAASVLTSLYKAGLGSKAVRETSLGLLVVPILVEMIAKNDQDAKSPQPSPTVLATQRMVLERAPLVLAHLITDCEYLQMTAFACLAADVLTKVLKRTYSPIQTSDEPTMWSPHQANEMDVESTSPIAQLGTRGQDASMAHFVKVREAALKAIVSLAAGKEDYRTALVQKDLVPYVVESLSEFPGKPRPPKGPKDKPSNEVATAPNPGYGTNPPSVIIAACHVVRALSRSVNVLRTSIVDYDVAQRIFQFLRHPDINVQTAATSTMVNLVLEFSPVREMLTEKGVMKILCEHAHSDNPALRLDAVWALKHFMHAVEPEMRKACLEELETGWLVQLIEDDTQNTALYNNRSRQTSGENMDEDSDFYSADEPHRWLHGVNGVFREFDASQSTRMRQAENKLSEIRETELNPVRKARNEDVAIQEQALNIIRNFIGRPEGPEMVDHLFNEFGQDRLFGLLLSKVSPKALQPFGSRGSMGGRDSVVIYPQSQIIVAVIYVLVHMAASDSRHRQLIVSQTPLLKILHKQSGNKDKEVRIALCHLVCNLTSSDDETETEGSKKQRAVELRNLGFETKLEALRVEDRDLDVRERAKTAYWQLSQLSQ